MKAAKFAELADENICPFTPVKLKDLKQKVTDNLTGQ